MLEIDKGAYDEVYAPGITTPIYTPESTHTNPVALCSEVYKISLKYMRFLYAITAFSNLRCLHGLPWYLLIVNLHLLLLHFFIENLRT